MMRVVVTTLTSHGDIARLVKCIVEDATFKFFTINNDVIKLFPN